MKERFLNFMQGRYGLDQFSKFLLAVGFVAVFGSGLFGNGILGLTVYLLGWGCFGYSYFRVFSRNVSKRYAENQVYLAKTAKVRAYIQKQKSLWKQRKMYHIYKCPGCSQKIRIPRGKGKIEVRCPKCGTTFIKNSWDTGFRKGCQKQSDGEGYYDSLQFGSHVCVGFLCTAGSLDLRSASFFLSEDGVSCRCDVSVPVS